MWADIKAIYRNAGRFALAFPLLFLIPVLVIGVLLGMVQAATSINEQTLSFVPKLIITAICLAIFGSSILVLLTDFTRDLFAQIPNLVR
jgi:flagellar biosynthetic protein FliQ